MCFNGYNTPRFLLFIIFCFALTSELEDCKVFSSILSFDVHHICIVYHVQVRLRMLFGLRTNYVSPVLYIFAYSTVELLIYLIYGCIYVGAYENIFCLSVQVKIGLH